MNDTDTKTTVERPSFARRILRRMAAGLRFSGWATILLILSALAGVVVRFLIPASSDLGILSLCAGAIAALFFLGTGLMLLGGIPFAAFLGFVIDPQTKHPERKIRRRVMAGFGCVGLAASVFTLYTIGCLITDILAVSGSTTFEHASFDEVMDNPFTKSVHAEALIPSTADDIAFSGEGALIFYHYRFSCKISEADFVAFAAERDYTLSTNTFINANDDCACVDMKEMSFDSIKGWLNPDCPTPTNYLSYWYGYDNCGGIILAFDRDRQTLHGSYSTN